MKSNGSAVKHSFLALGVCASLVAGTFGFGASAEARVPQGDNSTKAVNCRLNQEAYDASKKLRDAAKTEQERRDWQGRMDAAEVMWFTEGCFDLYGGISSMRTMPPVMTVNHLAPANGVTAPLTPDRVQQGFAADGVSIN